VKVKVILLNLRRKCIIIVCQIDTCGPVEDERRNLGVKVYGSGHCMSKGTGDSGVAIIRKGTKIIECCSLGGREMEARAGTWNLRELRKGGCMGVVW